VERKLQTFLHHLSHQVNLSVKMCNTILKNDLQYLHTYPMTYVAELLVFLNTQ
jgi:hypothetical protein